MPENNILTEFLVSIGWQTNEQAQKNFVGAIREGAFEADILASSLKAAGGEIANFAKELAEHFNELYLSSKKLHMPAGEIQAWQKGFAEIGISVATTSAGLNSFVDHLKRLPGYTSVLKNVFGVTSKDHGKQLEGVLLKLHEWEFSGDKALIAKGKRYQDLLGIPEDLVINIDEAEKHIKAYQDLLKSLGVDAEKLAEDSHKLETSYNTLTDTFMAWGESVLENTGLIGGLGDAIKKLDDEIKAGFKKDKDEDPDNKSFWFNKAGREAMDGPDGWGALMKSIGDSWKKTWDAIDNFDWSEFAKSIATPLNKFGDGFNKLVVEPVKGDMADLKATFVGIGDWITRNWVPTLLQAWKQLGEAWTNLMHIFGYGASTDAIKGGMGGGAGGGDHISDGQAGGSYSGRVGPHGGQKSILQGGSGRHGGGKPGAGIGVKGAYDLMKEEGATDAEATQMAAIAMAESSGNPKAHNTNAGTGDNSYGLWQINMLHKLGPERLAKYGLKSNDDLFDPKINARVALAMAREGHHSYSDWDGSRGGWGQYMPRGNRGGGGTDDMSNQKLADNSNAHAISDADALKISEEASKLAGKKVTSNEVQAYMFSAGRGHVNKLWCADYVAASLYHSGYKPLQSRWAADYMGYGTGIKNEDVRAGDIVIEGRHGRTPHPHQPGHAAIAKGPPEWHEHQMMIPITSGDFGNHVEGDDWAHMNAVARRVTENDRINNQVAQRMKNLNEHLHRQHQDHSWSKLSGKHAGDYGGHSNVDPHAFAANITGSGGGDTNNTHNQNVTIHVNGAQDAHQVAQLVHHEIQTAHRRATRNMMQNVS